LIFLAFPAVQGQGLGRPSGLKRGRFTSLPADFEHF